MSPNKSIKILLNYFLGPLLFGWLLFSIVQQVAKQSHLETAWLQVKASFFTRHIFYLLAAVLLVAANWGIEARKWQVSVAGIAPMGFGKACKAILSGVSFAVSTPNRIGEYVGRMMYLPEGHRLESIAITVVGSISQLLITLYAGLAGLLLLQSSLLGGGLLSLVVHRAACWSVALAAFLLTLFYFESGVLGRLLDRLLQRTRYRFLVTALKGCSRRMLLRLLVLSALRYGVFVGQYLLVFRFFGVATDAVSLALVLGLLFLAMAVIPSIALAEVGLRGQLSLALVGLFTANSLGIALTSVTIWLLNLVLPAIVGSVLILGLRLFKPNHEKIDNRFTVAGHCGDVDAAGNAA